MFCFRKDRCIHVPKAAISLAGVWFFGSQPNLPLQCCSRSHRCCCCWPAARRHAVCQVFWPIHAKHWPFECTRKSSANRMSMTWATASAAVCPRRRMVSAAVQDRPLPAENRWSKRRAIRSNCGTRKTLLFRLPVVRDGLEDRSLCALLFVISDWDWPISVAEVPTTPSLTDVLASTNKHTQIKMRLVQFPSFFSTPCSCVPGRTCAHLGGQQRFEGGE